MKLSSELFNHANVMRLALRNEFRELLDRRGRFLEQSVVHLLERAWKLCKLFLPSFAVHFFI